MAGSVSERETGASTSGVMHRDGGEAGVADDVRSDAAELTEETWDGVHYFFSLLGRQRSVWRFICLLLC